MLAEVEYTFRGVSSGESCCCQGQALGPKTKQLNSVVARVRLGSQWSVLWVKKHLERGVDSLYGNPHVSSQNGQQFTWSEIASHHPQQIDADAPVPVSQELHNKCRPQAPCARISAPGGGTAPPTLEGTMAARQEVPSVFPILRKVMAHSSQQNVAC